MLLENKVIDKILEHCILSDKQNTYYRFIPDDKVDIDYKKWLILQHNRIRKLFNVNLIENIKDLYI